MQIKLKQIIESLGALNSLCAKPWTHKHIKASYALSKLLKQCQAEMQDFNAKRDELLKQLCEPVEGADGQYKISPEYLKAVEALGNVEVELTLPLTPISLTLLEDAGIGVTPSEFAVLDWLIVEGAEQASAANA